MFQNILPVDRWGFSYAAQIEAKPNGLPSTPVTRAAAIEPGWLTTKSPLRASATGKDFSHSSCTRSVREPPSVANWGEAG